MNIILILFILYVSLCQCSFNLLDTESFNAYIYYPKLDCYLNLVEINESIKYGFEFNTICQNYDISEERETEYPMWGCSKTKQNFDIIKYNDTIFDIVKPYFVGPERTFYLRKNKNLFYLTLFDISWSRSEYFYPYSDYGNFIIC